MGCSSGSGSEGDEKKRKRMISNRESARRSRMRKQKQLEDLTSQVTQLRNENEQILASLSLSTHKYLAVEAENSVLRAEVKELSHRLESLNQIIHFFNPTNSLFEPPGPPPTTSFFNNNMPYLTQPISASLDMFGY